MVRALKNVSESGLNLNDTEVEFALNDIADIMDTMMTAPCSFQKAVHIERENGNEMEWIGLAFTIVFHRGYFIVS
jgi:hypothetical protein